MAWDLDQTNQGWATGPIYIPASAGIYTGLGPVKGMGQGANSQWSRTIGGDGLEAHSYLIQSYRLAVTATNLPPATRVG